MQYPLLYSSTLEPDETTRPFQCPGSDVVRYIAPLNLQILKQPISPSRQSLQLEQPQNMDALDWATGYRPSCPFQNIYFHSIYNTARVPKPQRPPLRKKVEPTEYFKEQRFLARDGVDSDSNSAKTPPEVVVPEVALVGISAIAPFLNSIQVITKYLVNHILIAIYMCVVRLCKSLLCSHNCNVMVSLLFAVGTMYLERVMKS